MISSGWAATNGDRSLARRVRPRRVYWSYTTASLQFRGVRTGRHGGTDALPGDGIPPVCLLSPGRVKFGKGRKITVDEMSLELDAAKADVDGDDATTKMLDGIILELHKARVDMGGDAEALLITDDEDSYLRLFVSGAPYARWYSVYGEQDAGFLRSQSTRA